MQCCEVVHGTQEKQTTLSAQKSELFSASTGVTYAEKTTTCATCILANQITSVFKSFES